MILFNEYEIRPVKEEDAAAYFALIEHNRIQMAPYFPKTMAGTLDLQHTRRFIRERIILARQLQHLTFVITTAKHGQLIGGMSLRNFDWTVARAEMGYFLDCASQGKGIATMAVASLLSYGFNFLQLNKIVMRIGTEHHASRRIAERNGLLLEGTIRQDFKTHQGHIVDIAYYGILKKEFTTESKCDERKE